jgi:hypothetical protein
MTREGGAHVAAEAGTNGHAFADGARSKASTGGWIWTGDVLIRIIGHRQAPGQPDPSFHLVTTLVTTFQLVLNGPQALIIDALAFQVLRYSRFSFPFACSLRPLHTPPNPDQVAVAKQPLAIVAADPAVNRLDACPSQALRFAGD